MGVWGVRVAGLALWLLVGACESAVGGGPDVVAPVDAADVGGELGAPGCEEGAAGCVGSALSLCVGGELRVVSDCAEDGWLCEEGACAAAGEESESEAAYRVRLTALRLENARGPIETDGFGGWADAPASLGEHAPADFFRVEKIGGAWWFLTPEGHPFVSKGVTDVNYLGAHLQPGPFQEILIDKYGDEEGWVEASLARLRDWGFNNIGPWSSVSVLARASYAAPILDAGAWAPRYVEGDLVADYWSVGFLENAGQKARERAGHLVNDANLLGFFLDNELFWGPDWRTDLTILQLYVAFPAEAPGREEALRFVREAALDLEDFNATWGTALAAWDELPALGFRDFRPTSAAAEAASEAFAVHAFHQYARVAVAALREVDPNHLVLGCRFAWYPGDALIRAAAEHFDVISLAGYHSNWLAELDAVSQEVDKPFFIEEFSFKATDSGLLNIKNYAIVVDTQKDRALAYDEYVEGFMRRPWAVGYHWYKWFDNPPVEGDFLSGDNFGLMNYEDEPYEDLVRYVREVNRRVERWHLEGLAP